MRKLPHTLRIFVGGVGFFVDFFSSCSSLFLIVLFLCYVEVTESHIYEFLILKFVTFPWALASGCIRPCWNPWESSLMRDGRWDLTCVDDDFSG